MNIHQNFGFLLKKNNDSVVKIKLFGWFKTYFFKICIWRSRSRQACILCMYLLIVQLVVMTAMVLLAHCLFLCWFVFLFCYKFWIAGNNYKDKTSIAIVNNSETVSTVGTCMEAIERRWRDNNTQTYCNTFKIYRPHFRSHTEFQSSWMEHMRCYVIREHVCNCVSVFAQRELSFMLVRRMFSFQYTFINSRINNVIVNSRRNSHI